MREILYRSKRRDNGEWIEGLPSYGFDGKITELECLIPGEEIQEIEYIEIDPETLCQYTGLEDNAGKRWEGDIFRADNGECLMDYLIEWDEWTMQWYAREIASSDGDMPLCEFKLSEIEVIGNMFDNPEIAQEIAEGSD